MTFEEKNVWVFAVVTVVAFGAYVVTILGRAGGAAITEVPYVGAMLWTIGAAIVASIVGRIVVTVAWPKDADKKDQRDKEIYRFGEYIGQSFVVVGAVAALVLAMAEVDHFWIANAVYLAFVLSALLSSTAKIFAYRRGVPSW
jgi:cell division protein FtsW (lipid II flippase)